MGYTGVGGEVEGYGNNSGIRGSSVSKNLQNSENFKSNEQPVQYSSTIVTNPNNQMNLVGSNPNFVDSINRGQQGQVQGISGLKNRIIGSAGNKV